MSPKNNNNFVGRKSELRELRQVIKSRQKNNVARILLILGKGGIGKTKLAEKMLEEINKLGILAPKSLLDFFDTNLRSIDGIQWKIVEIVEELTGLRNEKSPFAKFRKKDRDTSEQFNQCLREFCAKTRLALAFDTFELLDTVASNWLFAEGNEGLQVPGLICIVAGRPDKEDLNKYIKKSVKRVEVSGLSLLEIEEFYRKHAVNVIQTDPLDFWSERGQEDKVNIPKTIKFISKITEGHPLRVEMALNWPVLGGTNPKGISTPQTFEADMMKFVCERGDKGDLNIGNMKASQAVFDTLACMGIITRRFDKGFLKFLIEEGYIRNSKGITYRDILAPLEKYFFVKTRMGNYGEQVFQLHDEMARLVQDYVWLYRDPSVIERRALLGSVLQYYDRLYKATKDEVLKKNLRVERLYYTFKLDQLFQPPREDGKRLWFELANMDDEDINRLLPAEIREFKDIKFDNPDTRYEIRSRIARIEYEAGHIRQAEGEWEEIRQMGRAENRSDWIASALLSLAICQKDFEEILRKFQEARKFCEKNYRHYLPRVYYNIGFTYRRMQNVEKAIEWYKKAQKVVNPKDQILTAQIANDLGYAYSHVGEWEESRRNIKEGQKIRKEIKLKLEKEFRLLKAKIRSSKDKKTRVGLQDLLLRKENQLSKANFHVGLSHNTLGEICRLEEALDPALWNYEEAYKLFVEEKNYKWQAKALFSQGETLRRMAWAKYRKGDELGYRKNHVIAENKIRQSLHLCEKYRIKEERDTANRRMGRVVHDQAIHELERGNRKEAQRLLKQAYAYFQEGLNYAKETYDDLEILSNQTELAFLYDDFVWAYGQGKVPQEYQGGLKKLKRVLAQLQDKKYPIYQFDVFNNEHKLEEAAANYQNGSYRKALDGYLESYKGLAADPGYGRARYKTMFPHLAGQIEKLIQKDKKEAEKWCRKFIDAWETPQVIGRRKVKLAREAISPDMVKECWIYLEKIDMGRS